MAEGVETEEQKQVMKQAGCDYQQGYYYAKPLPMDEYLAFLEENRGGCIS